MCLTLAKNYKQLTAKQDIVVYKIIGIDNISKVVGFQYSPNILYRLRKALKVQFYKDSNRNRSFIEDGFHSYKDKDLALHLAYRDNHWTHPKKYKVVECIIRKGAKYYETAKHIFVKCYVSTSLRTLDLLDI